MGFGNLQIFKNSQLRRRILKRLIPILMGIFLALGGGQFKELGIGIGGNLGDQAAIAQSLRPEYVADIVYQRLPYLPKENQYISQETGNVVADNTLISRLIRYHDYVKSRPTSFWLDWKLTLADYLGANEPIKVPRYPGNSTLKTNPMEGDIKVITSLNRRQRAELVDILVSIYSPKTEKPSNTNTSSPVAPQPIPSPSPAKIPISKPGDAQLLMP
jgi:hypothetical protein